MRILVTGGCSGSDQSLARALSACELVAFGELAARVLVKGTK